MLTIISKKNNYKNTLVEKANKLLSDQSRSISLISNIILKPCR